ncbi:MAG: endonuclease/exonuclease/phosphatase family protein [Chloroflexota bacterium]
MVGLAGVYVVGLVLWQVLRFTPLATWWPFEVADIFGFMLYVPLLPLLLLSLAAGSRTAGLCLLLPVCFLVWEYTPSALLHRPAGTGRPLTVMTTNLLVSNEQRTSVGAAMLMEQPDIVAIQELGPEMASHLEQQLGAEYPYQLLSADPNALLGLGVLSRYPLHVEPETGWYSHVCGCQRVTVDVDGRTLAFINVHPPPPTVGQTRIGRLPLPTSFDASATRTVLAAALDGVDLRYSPLVIAGDFNTSDRQPAYRALRSELQDAFLAAGWGPGFTFPARTSRGSSNLSIVRIDYILHDGSVTARAAYTGSMPGSDHRYVVAELRLP